jgi:murein L,D-transpeptidase YcbB/YkuD
MHCSRLFAAAIMATMAAAGWTTLDCRMAVRALVSEASGRDQSDLKAIYEAAGYDLVWVRDGVPSRQAQAMIQNLQAAGAKGLNAYDYDGAWLENQSKRFRQADRRQSDRDLARFDVALTLAAVHYVSDLQFGRCDPKLIHPGFDLEHEPFNLPAFVRTRLLTADDIRVPLRELDPPFPGYRRTEQALRLYLALAEEGDDEPLPATVKPVEPGSRYAGAEALARLLWRLGDLSSGAAASREIGGRYEGPLVEAVKRFQVRHGLEPDGRLGAATLRELNTPLSQRVRQLQLTLERYRWVPHSFARPPVIVNIPEFRLRAMNESYTTEVEMKVVVGRAFRTRTPIFAREMQYVIFRPYWEVPPSIQRGEMVPKIERDSAYLERHGYELVSHAGSVVEKGPDALEQLRAGKVRIRQVPGEENALGLVKFLFPNPYNVYMHGTPAKELFSRSRRDFSHGCIRLEKPEVLAEWILRQRPGWTSGRIAAAMHGENTIKVTLEKPVPVLIVYATAVVLENGNVHFFNDIYGHDGVLDTALTSGARVPRPRE